MSIEADTRTWRLAAALEAVVSQGDSKPADCLADATLDAEIGCHGEPFSRMTVVQWAQWARRDQYEGLSGTPAELILDVAEHAAKDP